VLKHQCKDRIAKLKFAVFQIGGANLDLHMHAPKKPHQLNFSVLARNHSDRIDRAGHAAILLALHHSFKVPECSIMTAGIPGTVASTGTCGSYISWKLYIMEAIYHGRLNQTDH